MDTSELIKLGTCIEENLRASPSAGLKFVDSRHQRARLSSKQNHVIFGRRGAGKTTLVNSIRDSGTAVYIYLNLEDYKDITFPNIIIHVLVEMFGALGARVEESYDWYQFWEGSKRRLKKKLLQKASRLRSYLHQPDEETQEVSEREAYQEKVQGSVQKYSLAASGSETQGRAREVKRELPKSKIDYLRIELTEYKRLIDAVSQVLGERPIFLVLDDFYFIQKETQPEFVDYFHRLTKGTLLFLKVATIKHRSKLYRRRDGKYIGVELSHDIFEVDMDYMLDDFDELQSFMRQLLVNAIEVAGARVSVEELFAGEGFSQLCLASGGVPRDFLSLFVNLANRSSSSGQPIGKVQVTDAAISNIGSKMESMKRDSGDEDSILQDCLSHIKRYVYDEKRTNAFLVPKDDLEKDAAGRQAIRELVDLRLIHLVDHNTSKAPSDGRRYEAYILDIGLYDNSRPRNFNQIDPGQRDEKARKDEWRASPVLPLEKLREPLPKREVLVTEGTGRSSLQLSLSFE